MSTNPLIPAGTIPPIPPPVPRFRIADERGNPTPSFIEWCQLMWAAIQGNGGLLDRQAIDENALLRGGLSDLTERLAAIENLQSRPQVLAEEALPYPPPTAFGDALDILGLIPPPSVQITEFMQFLMDNTICDVSITTHGYAPKAPNDATKFLNGANPPAYAVPSGGAAAASQAEEEAASSTTVFTSPGRQHFHPGVAKCWAQVVVAAGTPTLTTSYNITSITDSATGAMVVTIATDFSSVNWCALALGAKAAAGGAEAAQRKVMVGAPTSINAGSIALVCYDDTVTTNLLADPEQWYFAGFGDQA